MLFRSFTSGTRSAICGGTTTIIPFAYQEKGQSLRAAVQEYHKRSDGKAYADYAFHLIITDPTTTVMGQELPSLIEDGYTSFKLYMTYDPLKLNDRQIIEILSLARRERAMSMIHAENTDVITWLTDLLESTGRTAARFHAVAHPTIGEGEATHRAISLSELIEVPILIVHVSSREAMEEIRRAQSRGLRVFAETCPQYLFCSDEDLARPGFEGAKFMCSPAPRTSADQETLWNDVRRGTLDVVSSDHSGWCFDGPRGKKVNGADANFRDIPNGVPGLMARLPILFSEGVTKGRIDLNTFVRITTTNPAKLFGLYPRKGSIAPGFEIGRAHV